MANKKYDYFPYASFKRLDEESIDENAKLSFRIVVTKAQLRKIQELCIKTGIEDKKNIVLLALKDYYVKQIGCDENEPF